MNIFIQCKTVLFKSLCNVYTSRSSKPHVGSSWSGKFVFVFHKAGYCFFFYLFMHLLGNYINSLCYFNGLQCTASAFQDA